MVCRAVVVTKHGVVVASSESVHMPSCDIRVFLPRQLAVDVDNNIYVTRAMSPHVSVYTIDGKLLGEIDYKFTNPFGIAISPDGIVAVSDDYGIHLFQ